MFEFTTSTVLLLRLFKNTYVQDGHHSFLISSDRFYGAATDRGSVGIKIFRNADTQVPPSCILFTSCTQFQHSSLALKLLNPSANHRFVWKMVEIKSPTKFYPHRFFKLCFNLSPKAKSLLLSYPRYFFINYFS